MKTTLLVFTILCFVAAVICIVLVVANRLRRVRQLHLCYRCADVATVDYMGLHYCLMCRLVIIEMIGVVRGDPPFGFPGARGYLEWPNNTSEESDEKKKEI